MMHSTVIVAVDRATRQEVERAIEDQMIPFDENGDWFRDGSRWDWYQVGGRFSGRLSAYDPSKDERNYARCSYCGGTGDRPDLGPPEWKAQCGGCNVCHGTGRARNHSNVPFDGDIVQVKMLNLETLKAARLKEAEETYAEAMRQDAQGRELLYGVKPEQALEEYVSAHSHPVAAHAFLRNRHWHESERMGFFGMSTYTECERKDMEKPVADPEKWFGKCLHKDEKLGAQIVCWNEPYEIWAQNYYHRFIEPLPKTTWLALVDYHV